MIELSKEIAKRELKRYKSEFNPTYRGVPVSAFDKEELLKIIDMYVGLIILKDKTITSIANMRIFFESNK